MSAPRVRPPLGPFFRQYRAHDTGLITAHGPSTAPTTPASAASDKRRTIALQAWLIIRTYALIPMTATFLDEPGTPDEREVVRKLFFVVDHKNQGCLRDDLLALGRLFEQDAITCAPAGGSYSLVATTAPPGASLDLGAPFLELVPPESSERILAHFLARLWGRPAGVTDVHAGFVVAGSRLATCPSDGGHLSIPEIRTCLHRAQAVDEALRTGLLKADWRPCTMADDTTPPPSPR